MRSHQSHDLGPGQGPKRRKKRTPSDERRRARRDIERKFVDRKDAWSNRERDLAERLSHKLHDLWAAARAQDAQDRWRA